jgi:hypothetical protein
VVPIIEEKYPAQSIEIAVMRKAAKMREERTPSLQHLTAELEELVAAINGNEEPA